MKEHSQTKRKRVRKANKSADSDELGRSCPRDGMRLVKVCDDGRYLECLCGYKFDSFLSRDVVAPETDEISLADLLRTWHEHFHIEDDGPILFCLATAVSNQLEGDPVWSLLVGPPSSIKTEIIRSLGEEPNDLVFPLSTLTVNTFISGQRKKVGLLHRLNGKILTIKDFTTILEKSRDARNEILAQLREIFDGYLSKGSGNEGAEYQNVKARITLLAGVTPVIDFYDTVMSLLGERFLKMRVKSVDPFKTGKRASRAAGNEDGIRQKIRSQTAAFLSSVEVKQLELSEEQSDSLVKLACFTANARTGVPRDWRGTIQYLPQSEGIARLYKQLLKLAWCLVAILGREEIDSGVMKFLSRVAGDTIDARRVSILGKLTTESAKTSIIGQRAGLPTETAKRVLEDLSLLNFVEKSGNEDKGYEWSLVDPSQIETNKYENVTDKERDVGLGLVFGDGGSIRVSSNSDD
ncbi:MAG: hypothetical protein OK438_01100 [Thaumarchaeota archaeon]|nr:hypothetical protein [Nitrososphaerota archaeon]